MPTSKHPKVSVAIRAANGNTLCGFRSATSTDDAERQFVGMVRRLRHQGWDATASVVVTTDHAVPCASIGDAERELLDWVQHERPTVQMPAQKSPAVAS